jgi:mannose-6-phosphate isomerase-like protein (cupin superfamily)
MQEPHSRDEIYVIASGSGTFQCGDARSPFKAGDVLFVPAGIEHRFLEFSGDFGTWVFFYGPEGGEEKAR